MALPVSMSYGIRGFEEEANDQGGGTLDACGRRERVAQRRRRAGLDA